MAAVAQGIPVVVASALRPRGSRGLRSAIALARAYVGRVGGVWGRGSCHVRPVNRDVRGVSRRVRRVSRLVRCVSGLVQRVSRVDRRVSGLIGRVTRSIGLPRRNGTSDLPPTGSSRPGSPLRRYRGLTEALASTRSGARGYSFKETSKAPRACASPSRMSWGASSLFNDLAQRPDRHSLEMVDRQGMYPAKRCDSRLKCTMEPRRHWSTQSVSLGAVPWRAPFARVSTTDVAGWCSPRLCVARKYSRYVVRWRL